MAQLQKRELKVFGEVLKDMREALGKSQQELADHADLNRTFISFLERGLRQPTLSTLFALSRALRIGTSQFILRVEKRLR